jgi:hypothetical protein
LSVSLTTALKPELTVFTVLPRIMRAPVFSMDACEETVEVHDEMIFGISHIPTDAGGGKRFKDFYNSNLNLRYSLCSLPCNQ